MTGMGQKKRSIGARLILTLALVTGSIAFMAEASLGQVGAPSIAFLNPSSFAAAGERGIIVSDAAPTAGPGCCDNTKGYRLSAWVGNAPPESRVFFSVAQRQVDIEITDTGQSGNNSAAWEANWRIPAELLDGPATLRAHLVVGDQQIAVAQQDVTILRMQDSARIGYPTAGGQFGTYSALADGMTEGQTATRTPPVGVVDATYYEDADIDRLRVFYSTSPPGTTPQWKACGTETLSGAPNGLRCGLGSLADQGKVTAVAAVTNDSPTQTPYEARHNQSGDAVAVGDNYQQTLTALNLATSGFQRVARDADADIYPCSATESVELTDQFGRAIAGANIDVHATGPSDALKFDHDSFEIWTDVQAPDRGGHALEPSYDCFTDPANSDPGEQGEVQRFGAPDRKHVESQAGGTTDLGQLTFALRSTADGVTEWTAWVDELDDGCGANDDSFTVGELFVSGSIGWGEEAVDPAQQPYETLVQCGTGPEEEPPLEVDGSRSITVSLDGSPSLGERARFSGRIDAALALCEQNQKVVLKMRRPGAKFWVVDRTTTDARGRFTATAMAKAPRDYRAVARKTSSCDLARSQPIKLRAN